MTRYVKLCERFRFVHVWAAKTVLPEDKWAPSSCYAVRTQMSCDALMQVGVVDAAHLAVANASDQLFENAVSCITSILSDAGSAVLSDYLTGEMVDDVVHVMSNELRTKVRHQPAPLALETAWGGGGGAITDALAVDVSVWVCWSRRNMRQTCWSLWRTL